MGLSVYMDRHTRFAACDASGGRKADWAVLNPATVRTKAILLDQVAALDDHMEHNSDVGATLRKWVSLTGIDTEELGPAQDQTAAILDRPSSFWHTLCGDILINPLLDKGLSAASTSRKQATRQKTRCTLCFWLGTIA
jgi:hypothetical protein